MVIGSCSIGFDVVGEAIVVVGVSSETFAVEDV